MSQALPVNKTLWGNTEVDCAPWGMKTKPTVANEIVKKTEPVKPTLDDVIAWGPNYSYALLYSVAQQCFPDFMRLDDAAEYLHELHEKAKEMEKEKATATDGVAAVFANVGAQMSSIKKANEEEEDKAVNDDQSNETLNEEGELVEAPENNEKPETNLKRKNAMINGSPPPKKPKQVTTTVNALRHVRKMKDNVAMINATDVKEMDKFINKIKSDMPKESIVEDLSLIWAQLRRKL